jgi:hypothetical protein
MLFKKFIAFYLDNRSKYMNTLFGHNTEFVNDVNA